MNEKQQQLETDTKVKIKRRKNKIYLPYLIHLDRWCSVETVQQLLSLPVLQFNFLISFHYPLQGDFFLLHQFIRRHIVLIKLKSISIVIFTVNLVFSISLMKNKNIFFTI